MKYFVEVLKSGELIHDQCVNIQGLTFVCVTQAVKCALHTICNETENMVMLQAVELVRKYNLSLALFSPSWVHEYLGSTHFVHLEYVFWQKLWPYLYVRGPTELPFTSSFCQGYGEKMYRGGQVGVCCIDKLVC